jgi:uncharacterized membrane protein YhaH (DUF805 family)
MDWLKLGFRRWADFGGRSGRAEYAALETLFIANFVLVFVASDAKSGLGILFFAIIALLMIVPIWAVSIRRLHDFGWPGVLFVIGFFIPPANLLLVLLCFIVPGNEGENSYGDVAGVPSDYLGKI